MLELISTSLALMERHTIYWLLFVDVVKNTNKKGEVRLYKVANTYIIGSYDNSVKKQLDEEFDGL